MFVRRSLFFIYLFQLKIILQKHWATLGSSCKLKQKKPKPPPAKTRQPTKATNSWHCDFAELRCSSWFSILIICQVVQARNHFNLIPILIVPACRTRNFSPKVYLSNLWIFKLDKSVSKQRKQISSKLNSFSPACNWLVMNIFPRKGWQFKRSLKQIISFQLWIWIKLTIWKERFHVTKLKLSSPILNYEILFLPRKNILRTELFGKHYYFNYSYTMVVYYLNSIKS